MRVTSVGFSRVVGAMYIGTLVVGTELCGYVEAGVAVLIFTSAVLYVDRGTTT